MPNMKEALLKGITETCNSSNLRGSMLLYPEETSITKSPKDTSFFSFDYAKRKIIWCFLNMEQLFFV